MSLKKSRLIMLIFSLVFAIGTIAFFPSTKESVSADETTYTITFAYDNQVLTTKEVNHGDNLTKADFPLSQLPVISENEMFVWFCVKGDEQTSINYDLFNGDDDTIIVENINSNLTLYPLIFRDPSKAHEVTFKLPDGNSITIKVLDGDDCQEPDVPLGFCERVSYSKSLKNIREDMTVEVTIDKTMKYVFLIGCATALLTSIVVIVVVILKVVNAPEGDDEDDIEDIEQPSTK